MAPCRILCHLPALCLGWHLLLDTILYTQLLSAMVRSESATARNSTRKDNNHGRRAPAVNHHDLESRRLSPPPTAASIEEKMAFLLHTMRQDAHSVPDVVAYNIVIRFYAARCGDQNNSARTATAFLAKLQSIVQQMKLDGVALDAACHASLVYGYARAGQIEQAQTTLQQMPMDKDRLRFLRLVGESVYHILAAHRQAIVSARANEGTDCKHQLEAMALRDEPHEDETNRDDLRKRAEAFYQPFCNKELWTVDSATEGAR
jgi:hypothetical protein